MKELAIYLVVVLGPHDNFQDCSVQAAKENAYLETIGDDMAICVALGYPAPTKTLRPVARPEREPS